MKVALVHDFLIQNGGAEFVLKIFAEMFPEAPIFTLVYDENKIDDFFKKHNIKTSFIQKMPFGKSKYQWFLPLMPLATEQMNLMDYDLVISSSSAFANGVITNPDSIHICYCHTPTRYLWTDTYDYIRDLKCNIFVKKAVPLLLNKIRIWDRLAADRPNYFLANSKCVQKRIERYYNRKSDIIYPPVETGKFSLADGVEIDKRKGYFLIGGRLVSYKRYDLVVRAFNKLGMRLKIFGDGPEEKKLKQIARGNIEFLGRVSDERRSELYRRAIAFINPQEEDFGITAVESMASGRPVVAYKKGGALETIIEGKTGVFFNDQNWPNLADTIIKFKPEIFESRIIRQHAEKFDADNFKREVKNYISEKLEIKNYVK
ncbi:MAG: glycosyltransferase [bacterium]